MADLQLLLLANGAVALGAAIQATVGFGMNLIALPLRVPRTTVAVGLAVSGLCGTTMAAERRVKERWL